MLLLDEAPYSANPNPAHIPDALWRFWCSFDRRVGSALLGGIWANKPGYHDYPDGLSSTDYSLAHVAADRRGPRNLASAIDLTLSTSDMRLLTGRLRAAALNRDSRLYLFTGPTLREYIGTTNGTTVECYVFTGGVPLGVGSDSGFDYGRDSSHLWHIHLSIIREYCNNRLALDGVLSVLIGESLSAYRARTTGDDMSLTGPQENQLGFTDGRVEALANMTDVVRVDHPFGGGRPVKLVTAVKSIADTVAAIALALPNVDDAVAEQLRASLAGLSAEVAATPAQTVALLAAQPTEDAALLVVESVGDIRARALAEAIYALTGGAPAATE